MVSVRTFDFGAISLPDDELLSSFLAQWYGRAPVPDEVLIPRRVEAMEGLEAALAEARLERSTSPSRRAPKVRVPQRGAPLRVLQMAMENAEHAFKQKRRASTDLESRLAQVQERLRLPRRPTRIECIDISHTGGDETVGAIVSLRDGEPEKKRYRSFHVRGTRGGDDYGAMYEVLSRRFRRARDGDRGWDAPDLLVVDGGKGQLGVALAALKDIGVTDQPVAALAKEKETPLGDKRVDRIYLPGQKNPIPVHSAPALAMLALARDEAHRFSNRLRTKVGTKKRLTSGLDSVKGVGPKTRAKLLSSLGSLSAVKEATDAELLSAGATRRQAAAIRAHFGPATGTAPAKPRPEEPNADSAERSAIENAFADLD